MVMRRTGFRTSYPVKPDRSAEFENFTPQPRAIIEQGWLRQVGATVAPIPKAGRFESEPWRRAVASLPCVLCGIEGQTQCAHRNEGKGLALKTDDCFTAALCTACHADIDSGSQHTKAARRERMDKAILLTYRALALSGRLRCA